MITVLAALNAKYIHMPLGVRSVAAYVQAQGIPGVQVWDRTINHRRCQLLQELAAFPADVMIFSCYIWNIEMIRSLVVDLRTIRPDTVLVAAGPEVSYHWQDFLANNPAFDLVLPGEGEQITAEFLAELATYHGQQPLRHSPAVQRRREEMVSLPPLDMDALPFPYEDGELLRLEGRIPYYESMRGCPFRCGYCLSSVEPGVRFRSLDLVLPELDRFLAARVPQVKLVDRTFNCDRRRALAIWRHLRDHDNGVTNFHFELAGELLDQEAVDFLATVRPGQFQFEIGVQSANQNTLAAIHRSADLERLFAMIRKLQAPRNIHLHLDLIAGLPGEGFNSFRDSFNQVYALGPDQFQLGFLKVLKGSAMEREAPEHGLLYQQEAPYQVLQTNWLSFGDLCQLEEIADLVDLYYNSGRFQRVVAEMLPAFPSPFDFYRELAAFCTRQGLFQRPVSKIGYYDILGAFLADCAAAITERHRWLCKYDLCCHEKPRRLPDWMADDLTAPHLRQVLAFYGDQDNLCRYLPEYQGLLPQAIRKLAHVEIFPFHPETGAPEQTAMLFNYRHRDLLGRAKATPIILPD